MSYIEEELIETRRLIRRGNFYLNHNDLEQALGYFSKALKYFPQNVDLLLVLAKLEIELHRNYDLAIRYLRDALEIKETDKIKLILAEVLMATNQADVAYDLITKLPSQEAKQLKLICALQLNYDINEYVHSNNDPILNTKPVIPQYAQFLHKQGNHAASLSYFKLIRDGWKVDHALGIQHLIMGSLSSASTSLEKALTRYKESGETDSQILEKLEIDRALAIVRTSDRIAALRDLASKYNNWRIFQALVVNGYTDVSDLLSKQEIGEFLEKAIDFCDDQVEMKEMEQWRVIFE